MLMTSDHAAAGHGGFQVDLEARPRVLSALIPALLLLLLQGYNARLEIRGRPLVAGILVLTVVSLGLSLGAVVSRFYG